MKRILLALVALALSVLCSGQGVDAGFTDSRYIQQSNLRTQGWTVIGNRTAHAGNGTTNTSGSGQYRISSRMEIVSPWTAYAPRFVYANWYVNGTGENTAPCDYWVDGSFMQQGSSINESSTDQGALISFNGARTGLVPRGAYTISDPVWFGSLIAGTRYFAKTGSVAASPAAPSTPSVSATTGSSGLGNAQYWIFITICYPNGCESLPSAYATATTTTGNQFLTVTAPTAVAGAIGYRVYINSSSATARYTESNLGIVPFGVNAVLSSNAGTTNQVSNLVGYAGASGQVTQFSGATLGGTGAGASNNGEYLSSGFDYGLIGYTASGSRGTGVNFPVACLVWVPGGVQPSVAMVGDSIWNATQDCAYAYGFGGYGERAVANQLSQIEYNISMAPLFGRISLCTSGETMATFAGAGGFLRSQLASLCTHAWIEYGTNDLGSGSAPIIANAITVHNRFLNQGMYTWQFCLLPRATSTDDYATLTNQSFTAVNEADRLAFNDCVMDATGQTVQTSEALFRVQSSAYAYGSNPYSGGDGSTTKFTTAYPFVEGTETVVNGGTTCTYSASPSGQNQYSYYGAATINGVLCASGVIFGSAPTNTHSITETYTKSAGLANILGAKYTAAALTGSTTSILNYSNGAWTTTPAWLSSAPTGAAVEYNTSGAVAWNGGYWLTSSSTGGQTSHSLTSVTSTSITDSSQSWTQDQWRALGMVAVITADSVTPTAVGQINPIISNTSTVLNLANSWTVTPSTSATYEIINTPTQGDVHPTSWVHAKLANAIGLTSKALHYP